MYVQINGFGQIQAEDTHNGFGINNISAGYKVKIAVEFGYIVYEGLYLVNGI